MKKPDRDAGTGDRWLPCRLVRDNQAGRKKSPEGREQRLTLLAPSLRNARQLFNQALDQYPRAQLQTDDILDAMVLAVIAGCRETDYCSLPQPPPVDRYGIAMRIVYAR
ncbi:DUF429 domain-containing protein [Thiohalophilus sp.]|uniref:DUF429 domain-containing protein n=1 Tax=Thiohalophilus sp. TaxID=3028392 RepID=UPI002ACD5958|nr:DUF429 domain-containing protein [Thiohalophilus sp.]MDZ7662003.1 DUF429 domain-containing protein [Thiohalophilus sp.]